MENITSGLEDYKLKGLTFVSRKDNKIEKIIKATGERITIILSRFTKHKLQLQGLEKSEVVTLMDKLKRAQVADEKIIVDLTKFPEFFLTNANGEFWADLESMKIKLEDELFDVTLNLELVGE